MSPLYVLNLVVVAGVVVLMPIIYFALIAGVGYFGFWWATEMTGIMSTEGVRVRGRSGGALLFAKLLAYLVPLFLAGLLLIFLLKPIFIGRGEREETVSLNEFEEPELFAFFNRVCEIIGAPKPKRIDLNNEVNASAGFARGFWSLFIPGDVVLTIGMPLVTGLTTRQFTGVMVHEFAHFRQGIAMRASMLINMVVGWFAVRAHSRDRLDDWLEDSIEESEHWIAVLILKIAQLLVFLTRLVLILLYRIALLCSAAMSRQMEYDADRFAARFVGSETEAAVSARMVELMIAAQSAESQAHEMWVKDKSVPRDMPTLIAMASARLMPEERERVEHMMQHGAGGLFDTHPPAHKRIKAVMKLNEPGIFRPDGQATALFRDIDMANMRASYAHFREVLGPRRLEKVTFVPIDSLVRQHVKAQASNDALTNFVGFDPPTWRPIFPSMRTPGAPEDAKAAAQKHRQLVKELRAMPGLHEQSAAFTKADLALARCEQAKTLLEWQLGRVDKAWGIVPATPAGVSAHKDKQLEVAATAASALGERADLASKRLALGLQLLQIPAVTKAMEDGAADVARVKQLSEAMARMKASWPDMQRVRALFNTLDAVLPHITSEEIRVQHRSKIRVLLEELRPRMDAVRAELGNVPDPYSTEPAELAPSTNLGTRIAGSGRYQDDPEFILVAARDMLERYAHDQRRMVGELVEIAMRVESTLERIASERKAKA